MERRVLRVACMSEPVCGAMWTGGTELCRENWYIFEMPRVPRTDWATQAEVGCPECGTSFLPKKRRGGRPRMFCTDKCSNRFHRRLAWRRHVQAQRDRVRRIWKAGFQIETYRRLTSNPDEDGYVFEENLLVELLLDEMETPAYKKLRTLEGRLRRLGPARRSNETHVDHSYETHVDQQTSRSSIVPGRDPGVVKPGTSESPPQAAWHQDASN